MILNRLVYLFSPVGGNGDDEEGGGGSGTRARREVIEDSLIFIYQWQQSAVSIHSILLEAFSGQKKKRTFLALFIFE